MSALLTRGWKQYWGILVSLLLHAGLLFLPVTSQNPASDRTRIMFQFQNPPEKQFPSEPELMSPSAPDQKPRQRAVLEPKISPSQTPDLATTPSPVTPDASSPVQPRTTPARKPSVLRPPPARSPDQPRQPSRVEPMVDSTQHPRITEVPRSPTRNQPRSEPPPAPSVEASRSRPDVISTPEDSSPIRQDQHAQSPVLSPKDEKETNKSTSPSLRAPSMPASHSATSPSPAAPETSTEQTPRNPRLVSRSTGQQTREPPPLHAVQQFRNRQTTGSPSPPKADPDVYLKQIRQRIGAAKQYPDALRQAGIEGEATLEFRLGSSGEIDTLRCVGCEGTELGSAAKRSLRRAGPFPGPPDSVVGRVLRITLIFRLEE